MLVALGSGKGVDRNVRPCWPMELEELEKGRNVKICVVLGPADISWFCWPLELKGALLRPVGDSWACRPLEFKSPSTSKSPES